MWQFHDFSITQILREINFWDSRREKAAVSTYLEALNFNSYEFLPFLKTEIYQINKNLEPQKYAKTTVLELLDSPKMILRKI